MMCAKIFYLQSITNDFHCRGEIFKDQICFTLGFMSILLVPSFRQTRQNRKLKISDQKQKINRNFR